MNIKKSIKKAIKNIRYLFSVKYAVNTPVLYGNLLNGRTALITGGTSGIGYAVADAFMRNGADVIITGRYPDRIKNACEKLRFSHPERTVTGFVLDNCDISKMQEAIKKLGQTEVGGGNIDILVNNAGVINKTDFYNAEEADYDSVMDTDLKGTYFLSKYISEYMREKKIKGNILNISSSSALRPANTSYHLAKWGIRGLTLGLAKELSQYGITVNAVAPGPTATEMLLDGGDKDISRPASPSQRFATAEEIANLATILVSDLGKMINGDTLYATGGCGNLTVDDW